MGGQAVNLLAFALSMGLTPGPNNVMIASSAATYGFRRTLPHMLGVTMGFPLMLLAVAAGLGPIFQAFPQIHWVLHYAGAAYLLYLASVIARSAPPGESTPNESRPFTFFHAAVFQWVNPKAWAIAIGALSTYATLDESRVRETMLVAGIFAVASFVSVASWATFGHTTGRLYRSKRTTRIINRSLAAVLVASVAYSLANPQ